MKTVPVAKALLLDSSGNMLTLRRSNTHPTLAGHIDLPGGLIESNEEPGQGVAREICEETGLNVPTKSLTLVYAGAEVRGDENRVRLLYIGKVEGDKPPITISWEHESFEWTPITELQHIESDFHSFYQDALHYIRENDLITA